MCNVLLKFYFYRSNMETRQRAAATTRKKTFNLTQLHTAFRTIEFRDNVTIKNHILFLLSCV